jgi:hypothetical protein
VKDDGLEPKALIVLNAQGAGGLGGDGVLRHTPNSVVNSTRSHSLAFCLKHISVNINPNPTQPSGPSGVQDDKSLRL